MLNVIEQIDSCKHVSVLDTDELIFVSFFLKTRNKLTLYLNSTQPHFSTLVSLNDIIYQISEKNF